MRLTKTTFTILAVCCALNAQAADDGVMIDLTVLDSLNGGYQVSDEPLFPIMPKAATKAKVKASAPKVKKEVKVEVNKDIKSVPETTQQTNKKVEEVVVVDIEPTLPQKENIISDVETKEILKVEENIVQPQQEEIVVPTAKVDINIPTSDSPKVENKIKIEVEDKAKIESDNVTMEAPKENLVAAEPIEAPKVDSPTLVQETKEEVKASEDMLLPVAPKNIRKSANAIVFADDVDTLSDEQMAEIEIIVSKFKNDKGNKIAIYSYNVDNGVDSFRKKRVSLNRAIEIRSYLLKKGFKNFSIKVVNIAENSPKINTVEISEI